MDTDIHSIYFCHIRDNKAYFLGATWELWEGNGLGLFIAIISVHSMLNVMYFLIKEKSYERIFKPRYLMDKIESW